MLGYSDEPEERLTDKATQRLASLLSLGDPGAEVALTYRAKERLRDYCSPDPDTARAMLEDLIDHCRRRTMPPELQKLGRTLHRWFDKIINHHLARISSGLTEGLNNLIKRINRIGFGSATSAAWHTSAWTSIDTGRSAAGVSAGPS